MCGTFAFLGGPGYGADSGRPLRVSISPFPYDKTTTAVETVSRIVRENANLYTVQLDNGVPWEAALEGKAYSSEVMEQWNRHKKAIGTNAVYLAIAPLAEDRTSWAPGSGGQKAPSWARDEKQATASLKKAYIQHVMRAIAFFSPTFVNIGVEAGDMAAKKAQKWPQFEELFHECRQQIKAEHPEIQVGISFGLPFLMKEGVRQRAGRLIDESDYVGISFYPYMSEFYSKLGAAPLPAPPQQWREPLAWLKQNIRKPVAICETAYSSKPVSLPRYKLELKGDEKLQSQYISDLASIARRDGYLFTVFFLSVDYVALLAQMPAGDGSAGLWTHTGFFDDKLKEKPAWSEYQRAWLGKAVKTPVLATEKTRPGEIETASVLGFGSKASLFVAPAPDEIALIPAKEGQGMRWKYSFRPREFSWAVKDLPKGSAEGSRGVGFALKSDQENPLLVQVEQADGGAFFQVIYPRKDWSEHELNWTSFKPDPKKQYKGKLDSGQLVRMMLVDATGVDKKASGSRVVEMSNLRYLKH